MKKIASFLLMLGLIVSCETDVTHNDPAFEAWQDGLRWRAKTSFGELESNQSITLTGIAKYETVTIHIASKNPGTYNLGGANASVASYVYEKDGETREYTTASTADLVDGQVTIDEFNEATMKISGSFHFNAAYTGTDPEAEPIMNFDSGHIYHVQVIPAL
jgi:hypothetical protein